MDAVCFSGQQWSFSSVFVDERFINKAQFDAGFAHRLILKDGAVPAIKDPDAHDSELQIISETASNVCVLLAIGSSARHSLAPPTTRLHSLAPPTTRLHSLATPTTRLHSLAPPTTHLHSLATPMTCLHSLAPPTRHAFTL